MHTLVCKHHRFLVVLLGAACFFLAPAQDRKTLEANKKKLEQEIAQTNEQLDNTSKQRKATVAELQLVNSNINKREQLIRGLNQEVALTDREIGRLQNKITRLGTDIENLKKEYAKLIGMASRHRDQYSLLMFLFSSNSFNQAWRRIRYLSQYDDYMRKQVAIIVEKQEVLATSRKSLETERSNKKKLVVEQTQAKKELEKEKRSKNDMVKQLNQQASSLRKKLKSQQDKVNRLNEQIKKIIEKEILASQKAAQKQEPDTKQQGTSYALTPAQKALSANFENNKGKLPWPLERGTISGRFGTHPHPVISNLTITNNGIDILTEKGAVARAVFKGEVCNIESAYGLQFVMVRHGAYISVYANLDQVYVKKGQTVDTKQKIGRVYYDKDENKSELQFQIWKNTTKLNPESWIAR